MAGIPGPPVLPRPKLPPSRREPFFERVSTSIDQSKSARLRRHAAQLSVGPTAVLTSVLFEALSFHCDSSQFTVTITTSERPANHADVVGDFTGAVLCSMASERGGPIGSLIRTVSQDLMNAVYHGKAMSGPRLVGKLREQTNNPELIFPVVVTSTVDAAPLPAHVLEVCAWHVSQSCPSAV